MSLSITRSGNLYEKTNTGKVVGTVAGGAIGAGYAVKNLSTIKSTSSDMIKSIRADVFVEKMKNIYDIFRRNKTAQEASKPLFNDKKLAELAIKVLSTVNKHPVAVFAGIGAGALLLAGCFTDSISNLFRAHNANKAQKNAKDSAIEFVKEKINTNF